MKTMAARFNEGDIFEVSLNNNTKGYFQYLCKDKSQLGGYVIRAFKKHYAMAEQPDLEQIVRDAVSFYTHTVLQWGIKDGVWKKVGQSSDTGNTSDILFRDTDDVGNPDIKVSKRWRIWRVNGPREYVGELKGENRGAEIGSVFPPSDIITRMQTGKSEFFQHAFE